MNTKITQDNLYMLLPLKIGWLAPWISEDKNISLTVAINRIYHIVQSSTRSYLPLVPCTGS